MCMKKNDLTHARTCVYNVNYHIVWSTKYRRKVLNSKIEARLKEILLSVALDKEFIIHEMEVGESDHIHLFVSSHPKNSISYIVKMMKKVLLISVLLLCWNCVNNKNRIQKRQ